MILKRLFSSSSNDPVAKLFFNPKMQESLKSLTVVTPEKTLRPHRFGSRVRKNPNYVFLTTKQLQEAQKEAREKATKMTQMPPVMSARSNDTDKLVISQDPEILGHDTAKYMFVDSKLGVHDRDRLMVTREPSGTLRHMTEEERERLNQIYFPKPGRRIKPPVLFEIENLEKNLNPENYLYVLNRNCTQFEPDNPIFIKTAHFVYNHVNDNENYDILQSTRFYGPMCFYLAQEKKIDKLLRYYFSKMNVKHAAELVRVYNLIHSLDDESANESEENIIGKHINSDTANRNVLEPAFKAMLQTMARNEETTNAIS